MKVLSLFSGIGATELAMAGYGWETVGFCEIEQYPVSILNKRFPGIPVFPDVTKLRGDDVGSVELICGGFPCQDLSNAGKRKGLRDEDGNATRSGLWFEFARLIREISPPFVLAENVPGAINLALDTVCQDLWDAGYAPWPKVYGADSVGAPHRRHRLFIPAIRRDIADRYEDVANSRCELLRGAEFKGTVRVEEEDRDADIAERPCEARGLMWPTPRACEYKGVGPLGSKSHRHSDDRGYLCAKVQTAECRSGQLNPDWVEILMGFPVGWTDIECDEPEPWPGWPAPMGAKNWLTPKTPTGGGQAERKTEGGGLRKLEDQMLRASRFGQYPYEPPRTVKGLKNRAKRLKALGNSNPPQQYMPALEFIDRVRRRAA